MCNQWLLKLPISKFLEGMNQSDMIIASPTSFHKLPESVQEYIHKKFNHVFLTSELSYDNILQKCPKNSSSIIGIGGGTAIDYAKYVTKNLHKVSCTAIVSMLSTNAFATNKVAVIDSKGKHTEQAVLPDYVVFDFEYLQKSEQENLYGLVDVFSIFNALRDWTFSDVNQVEKIDLAIYQKAEKLLQKAVSIAKDIASGSPIDYKELIDVIVNSGYITNEYGSGRPESGSEHILASALETRFPMPHALAVTLGIYTMTYFNSYNSFMSEHEDCLNFDELPFDELGIISQVNNLGLSYYDLYDVISGLKPRADKFTLVDILRQNKADYARLRSWLENKQFIFRG